VVKTTENKIHWPRWPKPTESTCLPADKDGSLGSRTKPFKVGDVLEWYLPII
jgi:hypothetical protein